MLQKRSILLEICLLVVAAQVQCQNYDYAVDEEDHADFTDEAEDSNHPDYSKYYSVDNSAPLKQGQHNPDPFISPIEFTNFFGPSIIFGESNNQEVKKSTGFVPPPPKENSDPFNQLKQEFPEFYSSSSKFPRDYFEESQQKNQQQQPENDEESSEIQPGPHYASYKVPSSDEVETIDVKKKKHHKKIPSPDYETRDYDDEYTRGKSSTYSQGIKYPKAPGLNKPLYSTSIPTTTLTPYQKYSFQPSEEVGYRTNYLNGLISTAAPFNPNYNKAVVEPTFESQSTENVPSHLKGCQKIRKPVSEAEAMECYVCENADTKSKYTQCSYTSEPNPLNYYSGNSERYSTPARGSDGFRYKRYADHSVDPYSYIKERSQSQFNKPAESQRYEDEDFHYVPENYEADELEKSFSEQQSEELKKNPENCQKIEKSGMTCTVCKNAKTGGNYEQCSYTSEPKEKKYAYVTEKKYDSEEPEETKPVAQTKKIDDNAKFGEKLNSKKDYEPVEHYEGKPKTKKRPERNYQAKELKNRRPQQFAESKKQRTEVDDSYEIPQHFVDSTFEEKKKGGRGLDPKLYGGEDSSEEHTERNSKHKKDPTSYENEEEDSSDEPSEKKSSYQDDDIAEYHFKLFPEFANEESRQEQTHYPIEDGSKQDVEEVLAEFTKKDRSNCKKAEKNGMTCYLCVDQNKIQHEECMYVSESRPKSTHIAYHEEKKIKKPEEVNPVVEESKRKNLFKKVSTTPTPLTLETAASEEIDSYIKYSPKKVAPKKTKKNKKPKDTKSSASQYDTERIDESQEPTLKTPQEFVVEDEGGAYSAETKPVYSKVLGVKLPKYMIEKSEFEKEFDEFSGSFY